MTGASRTYVSKNVEAGKTYTYTVRAEYVRNGETVSETKSMKVPAGHSGHLNFGVEQVASVPVKTALILHVPADAKVTLAGAATEAQGEVREFVTTKLPAEATWADYTVRVEVVRDGQTLVQEQKLTLTAGPPRNWRSTSTRLNWPGR